MSARPINTDVLRTTAEATLRRRVLANLRAEDASFPLLRDQMIEATEVRVNLDKPEVALAASEGLRRLISRVAKHPDDELDVSVLETVIAAAEIAGKMRSVVDLWFTQNATWKLLDRLPALRERAVRGDPAAAMAISSLERLATTLRLTVNQ